MHFCFPFHHSTSTQRFFKLCLRNQPVEKDWLPLYTFIVHNMQKVEEKKILPHTCITVIYRYMRICPDLVKNSLNKTSLFIQCPCKQNFVFRIKSEKEKPVLKDFVFIRIFVHFTRIFMPVGTKTPYTLQQTWKFLLQVCFFVITRNERVKGALSSLKQFWATESCLKMMENALNAFYFTSNILFVLKIFKFLS